MGNPYEVLGVRPEDSDEVIRARYLELVRTFSPEQHPQRFAAVRAAYDVIKDLDNRVRHRLFEQGQRESVDQLIEDMTCRTPRRRHSLPDLLRNLRSAR
jgi:curved DNA-binding protein CbpA